MASVIRTCLSGFLLVLAPLAAKAQDSTWQPITAEGVVRASSIVDSVFVEKVTTAGRVDGGDFTAYLMARLGVNRIPPDFNYLVMVGTALIHLRGKLSDLPNEARNALSPLVMLLAPETELMAEIELTEAGPRAVHFRLRDVLIDGVPVPDGLLQPVMAGVGDSYPALTSSGRDLYVEVPPGGRITLQPNRVGLTRP
jgi:hypothetical protein